PERPLPPADIGEQGPNIAAVIDSIDAARSAAGVHTLSADDPFGMEMNTLNNPFSTGVGAWDDSFSTGVGAWDAPFGVGMDTSNAPFGAGVNTWDGLFGEMYDAQIGGSFNDTAMDLFTQDTHAPFDQAMLDLTSQDFASGQWTAPLTGTAVGAHDHLPAAANGDDPYGIGAWDDPFQTLLRPHPPGPTASTSAVPASTTGEHQHDSHAQDDSDVEDSDIGDLFGDEGDNTPPGSQSTPLITSGGPLPRLTLPTAGPSTRPTRAPRVNNKAPHQDTAAPSTSGPTRTSRQKQRQKPYTKKGSKQQHCTVDERAAAITTWVQKDPTNRQNTIPPYEDSVDVGGKEYPVGQIFHNLTQRKANSVDGKLARALEGAGFTVEYDDDRKHMHIVRFQRMSDENARDFFAVYDAWLSEEGNIGQMPKQTLERPNPNNPGKQFNLGKFMASLKQSGHVDPTGAMAEMLEKKGGLEVIRLDEDDTSRFDGLRVPGEPPPKPRPLTPKQKAKNQERIAGILLWVGTDRKNSGKIPAVAEEVEGDGKVHLVGKVFKDLRNRGLPFHQGLFDVLKDNGFRPKVIDNKILIPRDKSMLATVAEKAERDKEMFAAYDLWCKGDSTRAGKIPTLDTPVTLPETGAVLELGGRMRTLISHGLVDPEGMIAQALSDRGLQAESRDGKTFLVRPKEAAGGGLRSVSAATRKAANPAVRVRPEEAAGEGSRSVSAATQKVASLAVGRHSLWGEGGSGSGVAVVSESVILPPGVAAEAEAEAGGSGVYWVGPEPQGPAAAQTESLLARMCKTVRGAAVAAPVIMLRPALDEQGRGDDLRDLRRLVQQFALKQQQPLVIAIDSASAAPLKQMSQAYGVTILHRVPGNATGTPATATIAKLDNIWLITNGPTTTPKDKSFTKPLVKNAAATPAHTRPRPVTPALAKLLLTPDRATKL
ncbi:hypothetical protein ACLQ24_29195, partial [Micromonospora sp. DT4]|uniref:hypothetical protein n=1 Tax=Micromonospora sp. DT4 TaxID=3393438 RepID=UPI003CED443D